MIRRYRLIPTIPMLTLTLALGLSAEAAERSVRCVDRVDLERFMGQWYVIGTIPTYFERHCFNSLERYSLREDGKVDTVFTCNWKGPDGKLKQVNSLGRIVDRETNARWKIRFFWPLSFGYRVIYLDPEYRYTAVSTPKGKYVWIMSREPDIPDTEYRAIVTELERSGIDVDAIRRVEHR